MHKHPVQSDGSVSSQASCSVCRALAWQQELLEKAEAQDTHDIPLSISRDRPVVEADGGESEGVSDSESDSEELTVISPDDRAEVRAYIAATKPRASGLQRAMYYAMSATHPPVSRVVDPLPEEACATPSEREHWSRQLEDLEAQVTGENAIPTKDLWDALPGSILSRVAPILGLPMPEEWSDEMPDFSVPPVFWHNVPLPPEIDTINVQPDTNELSDWILAERDYNERPEAQRRKFTQADAPRIELPSWYQLARKTAPAAAEEEEEAGEKTPEEEPKAPPRVEEEKIKVIVRKSVFAEDADDEEEGEEEEEKGEELEGEEEEEEEHEHLEEEEYKPEEKPVRETEMQRIAREKLEEESRIKERMFREELRRRRVRVKHFNKKLFSMLIPEEERKVLETSKELDEMQVDMEVHPPSTCPRDVGSFRWPYKPRNPYFNFVRKSPERAAVWRQPDKPATSGEAMDTTVLLHPRYNLLEKANHITRTITTEFLLWMDSLGGVQETDLTEDILQQLFDVTFDLPAAHALCVRVRELPVVTKEVADAAFAPQAEVHAGLREELREDVAVEGRPKHTVAFGRALEKCCPQRFLPPCNDVRATWVDCGRMPAELASGKQVFDGITQLQSVQKFCEFLDRNPRHSVPEYLRSIGMVGLTGLAGERVRRRGGLDSRDPKKKKKRRRKRHRPPTPEPALMRLSSAGSSLSSALSSAPASFHAADRQVLRGHMSGTPKFKFERDKLGRHYSQTFLDRDDGV